MHRVRRWARHEPWMALTAFMATLSAATLVSIRWLGLFGAVRVFTVTHTSGTLDRYATSTGHRQLGLSSGPSTQLTNLDHTMWALGLFAGALWMLRLGLRGADRRIGVMRGIGLVTGFVLFIVTGVMHSVAEALTLGNRDRTHRLITLWCGAAVLSALFAMFHGAGSTGSSSYPPAFGDHAVLAPLGWSILHNALQLAVVVGGWLLAASLTRRWIVFTESPSLSSPLASRA